MKLGDESSDFFHAKATLNHRNNFIVVLQDSSQNEVSDHDGKAAILWDRFKGRMGQSNGTSMHFNLQDLYTANNNEALLQKLEAPFTNAEVKQVIDELPNGKSPGPDGFNNEFIRNAGISLGFILCL